jgi:DNA replication protein DnaC
VSVEHVHNVLARLNAAPRPEDAATALKASTPPLADTARYDSLRSTAAAHDAQELDHMRELVAELKELRLHGMALAWAELLEQGGNAAVESSRWLLEHLLQAEVADRAMRSVRYQTTVAKFPVHRDLAGFDFELSPVDRKLVLQLADMSFTEAAHNVVFVGGPGTGKRHLATAIGMAGITRHGKRVRFYSVVDLVNALEQEKAQGRAGRIAASLLRMDAVVLDELGYLPFSQAGGALLFHLLSRLYEHTSVIVSVPSGPH